MRFHATVEQVGKTATVVGVPDDIVAALGAGRRPAVRVAIGAHAYRTTVASRGGRFLVPLSAENRVAAGVSAGEEIEVDIELDTASRKVTVPPDLAAALAGEGKAQRFFDDLSYTHRKEWVRWVEAAKKPETRAARVAETAAALASGKRTR